MPGSRGGGGCGPVPSNQGKPGVAGRNNAARRGGGEVFGMMVYKYLTAARFFEYIDEYLAGKLYFANWKDMNDPMEGFFMVHKSEYEDKSTQDKLLNELKKEKQRYKICSASKVYKNFLLWSHYADSHKGICIGIEVNESDIPPHFIKYEDQTPYVEAINNCLAADNIVEILTTKMNYWKYEAEIRFLADREEPEMIKIGVTKKIILGARSPFKNFFKKYVHLNDVEISEATIDHKTGAVAVEPLITEHFPKPKVLGKPLPGENTDHAKKPFGKKKMLI
jgi:hypothetical protein